MKDFFQSLWNFWLKMFIRRELNSSDILAKYVFKEKETLADGRVAGRNLKPREGEMLSLSEVTKLKHQEICVHGHNHVDNPAIRRIHIGYGLFLHESFTRLELKTIYDNKPPRHVSVKFPDDPEQRREQAKALADEFINIETEKDKKYFFSPCD